MKNQIFVDAAFIVALTNRRDQYHELASELSKQFEGFPLLVTDSVLLEVGNALARSHKQDAVEAIERLMTSDDVEVIPLTPELFQRAFTVYRTYRDKAWSLVDCISFIVMRDAGITDALTTDRHFEQAGFQVLMQGDAN